MVPGLSPPHRAARRGRLMPLATWSFPLQRGYCSSSNTLCGVTSRTIRCVWYKQRRLGCQALGGCRTAGQEFWGMQLVTLGEVCLATTLHPPPPPPGNGAPPPGEMNFKQNPFQWKGEHLFVVLNPGSLRQFCLLLLCYQHQFTKKQEFLLK